MGERRLFSVKITESDAFLDMPLSTQALYFHLCLNADDDGVIDAPRKILRMVGAQPDDLNVLITKRFLLQLNSSVIVVKHWLVHNSINKQRYKVTKHHELMKALYLKGDGTYTDDPATAVEHWKPVVKQCLNNVETSFNLSQVKSSQVKLSQDKLNQSSIYDLLTDDEERLLTDHIERSDMITLLDRLDTVDAGSIQHPYAYCVKVAKEMGVYR